MDGMLPAFVVLSAPKEKRGRIAEAMLPGLAPVAAAQRATVAAVAADQVVRASDRRQEQAVADSVSAVQTVITKPDGARTLTDQDLAGLPILSGVLSREGVGPGLRAQLDSIGDTVDGQSGALAAEATAIIARAIALPQGDLLSEADLEGTRIGELIAANPTLKAQVVAAVVP